MVVLCATGVSMSKVAFAFLVATSLFLTFKETRWMGVIGVFVLVCLNPLLFGTVALLAGLAFLVAKATRS